MASFRKLLAATGNVDYPERAVSALAPTARDRLTDARGRPYFLWDDDMSLDTFVAKLADPDVEVRAYFMGKMMRQAKPDDVFTFVTVEQIEALWPQLERFLGQSREFWRWLLDRWSATSNANR